MLMFRFWGSERGSEKTVESGESMPPHFTELQRPTLSGSIATSTAAGAERFLNQKRRRQSIDNDSLSHAAPNGAPSAKRAKQDMASALITPPADAFMSDVPATNDTGSASEAIQYQFGLEILLKHNELRLINQELAKCQVALEQLRRCHLIPYPTSCPTPQQMVEISDGKGPAVQRRPGEFVPQWAPPFGVVDGPYARHYAKWLIPDPKFDGMQPEWQPVLDTSRSRASLEGRTTRNSIVDLGSASKSRTARALSGQKLQALSSGYPQPKEKAGPCVLKRADGKTVKLVCLDCQRENFSSTQGFINHCRIAHRRDFKSHEEAAVHSGHPIEVNEVGAVLVEENSGGNTSSTPSGLVHPFAQADMSTQQAYVALRSRIADSLKMYHQGKLPGVASIPSAAPKPVSTKAKSQKAGNFVSAPDAPFLSRLMQSRKFNGNLSDIVSDAKQKIILEDISSPGEDSEDAEHGIESFDGAKDVLGATRAPVIMRVPARAAMSPAPLATAPRPTSSKGHSPNMGFASPPMSIPDDKEEPRALMMHDVDVDMDVDLSPSTLVSNNAPSLVSDDGEYDDSDDGSSESDASESLETESVSDVAEINIEEDHEPRPLRHHGGTDRVGTGTAMRLKKEENKHVTFVSPVKNNAKRARKV